MNDAKEFRHGLDFAMDYTHRYLSELGSKGLGHTYFSENMMHVTKSMASMRVFVGCFTENGDLLSQWRGYSGGGGISFGFDTKKLEDRAKRYRFHLDRCIYDDEEKMRIISDLIKPRIDEIDNSTTEDKAHKLVADCLLELIRWSALFKDSSFSEEAEWRLFKYVPSRDDSNIFGLRATSSMLFPYMSLPLGQSTDNQVDMCINNIFIGPSTNQDLVRDSIVQFMIHKKINFELIRHSSIPYRSI